MNRRTKALLFAGGLAAATAVVLSVPRDPDCKIGFGSISCTRTTTVSMIGIPDQGWRSANANRSSTRLRSHRTVQSAGYADATLWAVVDLCPEEYIAKRQPCISAAPVAPVSDDLQVQLSEATGLPLPERWLLATTRKSPLIKSVHVETPLDLATVLGFYRAELSKRGWTENAGAVVEPDRAVIAFTTIDGVALLRLVRASDNSAWMKNGQDERTIADLSLRTPAAAKTDILPRPGQVKLMFGNQTDEEAVITINEQTVRLAARAGDNLTESGRKSPDTREIDLPPGKYKVTFAVASGAAHIREFEVGADETWGLVVGWAGVPLPVHLY
jgi:hypothetical protein